MTTPPPTPPDPALWTWTDQFDRTFLGPDYTATNGVTLASGQLKFGPLAYGVQSIGVQQPAGVLRATIGQSVWSSADLQLQLDWKYTWQTTAASTYLAVGFDLLALVPTSGEAGTRRLLRWANGLLSYGYAQNAEGNPLSGLPDRLLAPNTWERLHLTIDAAQGRLQLQEGEQAFDLALPSDFLAEYAGGAELSVIVRQVQADGPPPNITLYVDNLAIRSGDGTADLSTGTANSSGGIRLGGEWRFAPGPPDDSVGSDGDVWADSTTGTISRKTGGVYVDAMQLLGAPGPQGEQGPQGPQGIQGPAGRDGVDGQPGELVGAVAVPLLLGDATPDGGLLIPLNPGPGSLIGSELLGVDGPAVLVEHASDGSTWAPVAFPFVLPAGVLRLTRADDSGAVAVLRARSQPVPGGGSGPGFTVQTDPEGFETIPEGETAADPDGFELITNATATPDPDGFETVERSL
ncbi:collagen-like protein [Deinococcus sp. JMULE3]|uniref:collagen-like protein n=1 Tax=Deinococcus sp. JMULE3 TaxID=2518341 RepID=UPI001576E2B2|nr:collagen-like protein [Deinococcus sp. JMULE3]NTX99299.1 collagen-like protein [Deinococcus sp. JMULE3]